MSESLNPHMVKTRKSHVCFGCGREFPAGTKMERSGVADGGVWTCYLCETCLSITQKMKYGDEFGHGDLREEALEIEAVLGGEER